MVKCKKCKKCGKMKKPLWMGGSEPDILDDNRQLQNNVHPERRALINREEIRR